MMSARTFPDKLILLPNDDPATAGTWPFVTGDIFRMFTRRSEVFTVPANFKTDFASIPWFLHWWLPPWGTYVRSAIIHDWHYRTQRITRKRADDLFSEGMQECETTRFQDFAIYWSVRLFGWIAWNKNKRAMEAAT